MIENKSKIDRGVYKILDAFARGVNEYIARHRETVPAWIDGITAEDVEALERSNYMRFYSIQDALMKLSEPTWGFPDFGSNQWAIAPQKSANGRIIHVEHTHMPWANRFQNYEAHLITPGKMDVAGISWFGSPVFLDGFNDRITWSATWNQPNISDVYEEKTNPDEPLQYRYEGAWRDMKVEQATFRVKGPKGMETVTLPLYYTHHGPVVKFDKEKHRAWSVRLPNFDGVNYTLGLYGIMRARNLEEFKAAVAKQLMPRWNLLYSDSTEIYWVHNGNVAQRDPKFDWLKPVPGWTKETEWGPFFPFAAYPQVHNPASGFLQNCNNPYWVATRNSGLKPLEPAPYYLSYAVKVDAGEEALNTRGERIFQVLTQSKTFTLDEMMDLAFDTVCPGGRRHCAAARAGPGPASAKPGPRTGAGHGANTGVGPTHVGRVHRVPLHLLLGQGVPRSVRRGEIRALQRLRPAEGGRYQLRRGTGDGLESVRRGRGTHPEEVRQAGGGLG